MSRFVRGFVVTLAGIIGLGVAAHAKDLTLDDCIDLALKNRASIIAARGAAELSKATEREALGAFLPGASASWNSIKTENKNIHVKSVTASSTTETDYPDFTATTTTAQVGASINFILPDAWLNYQASRTDRMGAQLDVIGSEQDLILAVKQAFYAYLASVQSETVSEEAVKRSEEQLKLVQSRFDLGSAAKSDVLTQKVQYGNDKLALLQAKNLVTTDQANLAYTIGLDPAQDQSFSTEYTVHQYDGTLADAIKFGLEHKPSLLAQQKAIQSSNTRLWLANLDYLPKVGPTVGYGYQQQSAPGGGVTRTTTSETAFQYGLGLTWNLFDGFSREQKVTSAKILRNNANAQLAEQKNQVVSQIKTAYLNIQQLKEQKDVSQATVDAATENLKITQEKYNLGAAAILDLFIAQVSLTQAQVSLIQADLNLNLAVSSLENAMGKM